MTRHDGHRVLQAAVLLLLRDEGLILEANCQRERRRLAERREASVVREPTGPNKVWWLDFSEFETTTGGTWRIASCRDYRPRARRSTMDSRSLTRSAPNGATTTTPARTRRSPGTGSPRTTPAAATPPSPASKSKRPANHLTQDTHLSNVGGQYRARCCVSADFL